ncbi:hypothetical protein GRI40_01360 [Altererythrobacter aerius]|uniref:DUF3617 family protein n=1 Tax=Tsuneonella aeria TaxID=1837929 RepID=A0A6I4T964_9SPHN|nr:hypothetical protein [Tsuneonella aeria]MXO73871.1 hypothetical protein [Tsuneonella aeria]
MTILPTLFAPVALLMPGWLVAPVPADAGLVPGADRAPVAASSAGAARTDLSDDPVAAQVRIQQRVIVRIAPPGPATRQSIAPDMMPRLAQPDLEERKMGNCVAVSRIAAVQPDAKGRLLLFMRDRRLVAASLEKSCSARDFYSGFYLERTNDGMLCVDRDRLHSRSGSKCEISRMRQLVADRD